MAGGISSRGTIQQIHLSADFKEGTSNNFDIQEVYNIEQKAKKKGIYFKVSDWERNLIEQKMALAGVHNMSAFIRKMAIDGYVVNLEIPELAECVRLLRYTSNNVNQIARALHSGGAVYPNDVGNICAKQDEANRLFGEILQQLSRLK